LAAARAAQCHDFIERLPEGYDTVVGGSGVHLSGGERQRIVIARAILKDTPIIVLDEATAFADPENEHRIQLAFEELMKDKTVIIIAHRLSTVRGADTIVVLDEGRVVEQGSHEKLVATDGRYSHMWEEYNRALGWSLGAPATRPLEPLAEAAAWLDTNEHASSPPQSSAQSATPQKPQKHQGKEASHV
jgi:ATP-binding cassette subfamily B protein